MGAMVTLTVMLSVAYPSETEITKLSEPFWLAAGVKAAVEPVSTAVPFEPFDAMRQVRDRRLRRLR